MSSHTIGPYTVGEKPAPLEVNFADAAGNPLNLTGYTAKVVIASPAATTTRDATVTDAAAGQITYSWDAADLSGPSGVYEMQAWVGNLTNRFASERFTFTLRPAVGGTAPAI